MVEGHFQHLLKLFICVQQLAVSTENLNVINMSKAVRDKLKTFLLIKILKKNEALQEVSVFCYGMFFFIISPAPVYSLF